MAITYTVESQNDAYDGSGVWTGNTFTIPSGCDKLVIIVGWEETATANFLTGVDVGGNAATNPTVSSIQARTRSNAFGSDDNITEMWYLDAPPTGSVTIKPDGNSGTGSGSVSCYYLVGAATGDPEKIAIAASAADPLVVNITTVTDGAFVIGGANNGTGRGLSGAGSGETIDVNVAPSGSRTHCISKTVATAGADSITFDYTSGPTRNGAVVCAFTPSGGGGGPAFVASPPFIVQQAVTRAATF